MVIDKWLKGCQPLCAVKKKCVAAKQCGTILSGVRPSPPFFDNAKNLKTWFYLVWCELRVMDQLLPYTMPCCCAWSTPPTCDGDLFFWKWGPNFEWNGDLMGTFASRTGDPKSVFWWINWNKLIPWNKDENNYSQNVAANSSIHLTFSDKLAWDWYKRVIYHK